MRIHLRGSDVLLLESNHDLEMLKVGPYPWAIKQRVMSRMGHLSNDAASCVYSRRTRHPHLHSDPGPLSEHNNHPALVRASGRQASNGRSLFTRLVIADPRRGHGNLRLLDADQQHRKRLLHP